MPAAKEPQHEPQAEPTTVQLWQRRQRLTERLANINAELAEINAKLKAELEGNQ
jgi:hypothetical protein